ncbi:MAG: 3-hydroxyacyl-ACP dehydratase FabZ [Christensenellales bacterium]|jgi:3-hydroxyacyl-[acyl-carrier-protein] dehydratase
MQVNIGKEEIQAIIPHRDPFLLIDEILELEPGKSAIALWHIDENFDLFRGHFPEKKILPGVLIVESFAQTGAAAVLSLPKYAGMLALFGGIKDAKFRRPVLPGDVLKLEVEITRLSGLGGKGKGKASVDGELACQGEILFAFANR